VTVFSKIREVTLRHGGVASRVARGHPWIWQDAVAGGFGGAQPGEEVQVVATDGTPVGRGLADPRSPIVIRMWARDRRPVDSRLLRERVEQAFALRKLALLGTETDAYRLVHGEGDRMPGLVVDRYAGVAVIRLDGEGAAARVADFAETLWPHLESMGIESLALRSQEQGKTNRLERLKGSEPPETVKVVEHGVPVLVDLAHGQKTGAFLDQRDNRRYFGALAAGRRVLNLYSYAGGFSVRAALGGAKHVTSVDLAAGAHATAQANFRLAGLDPREHDFVVADVPRYLEAARSRGQHWDLIVSDPPSFAPSERVLARALAAYRALHRACADVLAWDGIFCAASCSSHVDAAAFLGTLDDDALGGRELRVLELRGTGPDHPCLAAFPEGRYLKFVVLA
jgi:23S rRNA (cytosine1962-C5)-methyltransferase